MYHVQEDIVDDTLNLYNIDMVGSVWFISKTRFCIFWLVRLQQDECSSPQFYGWADTMEATTDKNV